MEQRLFIIACIMYGFTLITRWLNKKQKITAGRSFAKWHAVFLCLILSLAVYMFLFVKNGGEGTPTQWGVLLPLELIVVGVAFYGYFKGLKANDEQRDKITKSDLDWSNTVYFAGFVASLVMFFFVQAFKIPSASMRYTLMEGDQLFVNKAAYGFRVPFTNIRFGQFQDIKVGDIIVFKFPAQSRDQHNCGPETQYGRDFVKRVVAMPGDTVQVKRGKLWVNGKEMEQQPYEVYEDLPRVETEVEPGEELMYQALWENHTLDNYLGGGLRDSFGPVIVPPNTYFAMGDNRDNSCDSRFWGPVPRENIKGKAWFVHWPLSKMHFVK
ncbi:MAG: signal peptidase I [Elusimicrobiaceae bacterium]|nr:signal peptidase I [Elusimicrobiaceae bacterium]